MGPSYPGVNTVWDPSQVPQNLQPNVQVPYYQPSQPMGYNQIQQPFQPVQPTIQVPASSTVQQPGLSTPRTPPQNSTPASFQATTPIPGVSAPPISTSPQVSQQITIVSAPQPGPTIYTIV